MTPWLLYAMSGGAVFSIALYGVFSCEDVLRKIIAANLLGSGVFLILVAIARRSPAGVDPVPHALVLTGIVVSVSATACALALARRLRDGRHDTTADPVDLDRRDERGGPGREP
jgi:multicomponent Na+:H+ antiporter subunit C